MSDLSVLTTKAYGTSSCGITLFHGERESARRRDWGGRVSEETCGRARNARTRWAAMRQGTAVLLKRTEFLVPSSSMNRMQRFILLAAAGGIPGYLLVRSLWSGEPSLRINESPVIWPFQS